MNDKKLHTNRNTYILFGSVCGALILFLMWGILSKPVPKQVVDPGVESAEKAAYIRSYLVITNLDAGMGYGPLDEYNPRSAQPTRRVKGAIKNTGNRTVGHIGMSIYMLDREGNRVGNIPVFTTFDMVLHPNYSQNFDQPILPQTVSPEWSGKVQATISDCKFMDTPTTNSGKN